MPKPVARLPKRAASSRRRRGRRAEWVRKSVVMDQRKLDAARRALGVETETEAIDQALDLITFGIEVELTVPALAPTPDLPSIRAGPGHFARGALLRPGDE